MTKSVSETLGNRDLDPNADVASRLQFNIYWSRQTGNMTDKGQTKKTVQ